MCVCNRAAVQGCTAAHFFRRKTGRAGYFFARCRATQAEANCVAITENVNR